MSNIIITDGNTQPNDAANAPRTPRSLYPMNTAMFTANTPGADCATASKSTKSAFPIQRLRSTTSLSMSDIMAYPPPKVKSPMRKNVAKSLKRDVGIRYLNRQGQTMPAPESHLFIGGQADPAPTILIILE